MAHHSISHLMLYNAVFIVQTIIGTGIICAVDKAVHFVLVQIYKAGVALVILVINDRFTI